MAVSSPPILKILSDLDIDLMDIDNDVDYLRALMEATNMLTITNASDKRIPILQEEIQRVRADRKKADPKFKERKTKINIGSFLGRDTDDESQKLLGPAKDSKEQKKKAASGGLVDTINVIAETVAIIEDTLISQKKLDEDKQKNDKQLLENLKRDDEESRLGKVTGFLKKTGDKIIAPVQNIFGQIFGFIKKLILGKIFLNILDWFGNPANSGKIDSIVKFFSNNWTKLLSLYLIFGTGLGRFVQFITKVAIKGTIKLIALLAKLAWAKKIKGASGIAKFFGGKKGKILGTALTAVGTVGMYAGMNKMLGGVEEEPQKFNKGGKVRGQGDKDTVPAMLTPGEFVMSKGAVQQYGIDTMEAMNAAAGGTNVPVLMPDKKRKGFPGGGRPYAPTSNTGVVTDPKERQQQEAYMLKYVNEERAFQGLPPLTNLTYAPNVELTKMRGPGPRTNEISNTNIDFDKGFKTTTKSKTVDGKTTFSGGMSLITQEDRDKFFAENPHAKALLDLKDQVELDNLGADISASAKMKGGGLVQHLNNGGRVYTQEEANAMAASFDNRLLAQIQKLRNERDQLSNNRGSDGKLSRKDRKRWNEISAEIAAIQKKIISSQKSTTTPTVTPKKPRSGGFGLKRMIGGAADHLTGNLFDFDKRSGGGLIRKTAGALARPMGGLADMLTGNLFDFDNRSGGGLIRKTANAIGGLFGGSKPSADKVMAKEPKIKEIKIPAEGLDSLLIKIASKQDIKTPVGQPSLSGPKITVIPENKQFNTAPNSSNPDGGKSIPKFDVGYGSQRKMKQLGISR